MEEDPTATVGQVREALKDLPDEAQLIFYAYGDDFDRMTIEVDLEWAAIYLGR